MLLMTILFISVSMFFSGLAVFVSKRKHLLLMLLSLEFVVLALYLNIFFYVNHFLSEYFFSMIFITFSVCEGVLGLSMLVSMIRSCGNDYILSFSSLW